MTYHVQFLPLVVAGWVNRQQQDVIDYLREENRVLLDRRSVETQLQEHAWIFALDQVVVCMVTIHPPKTIVEPTALGTVANTDSKLLIYRLFQKGRVLAQDAGKPGDIRLGPRG